MHAPHIRLATEADLAAINAIYNHYVEHSTCTYQLAPESDEARLAWFHRHGAAHPVTVADLIARARALGHHTIIAGISAEQTASIRLHAGFGFEEIGRLREVGFKH